MRLLAALLLLPALAQGALLSEFSCARPKPYDSGSWHNASVAARSINGAVVAPGATFSFLDSLSPGQADFVIGRSLSRGRVVSSKGGGYCQVSAAIYNAVLLAGLPVGERYNHSFFDEPDAYVEPGRDAAVSGSSNADFKFENTTASALTLSVSALDGRIAVQVWGALQPKARWITTEPKRIPHTRRLRDSEAEPGSVLRPGFDGWVVKRWLNVLDAEGNTRSSPLSDDTYEMIPELVAR